MALQCPRCELRFDLRPMLADHLRTDHGMTAAQTDHLQPPGVRAGHREPGPPPAEGAEGRGA